MPAVLLAAAVAFSFQGKRGLYATTEVRYAEVAREMLQSGDYLEPTLSGRPHWTKPPLTYAALAASMRAFGVNTWALHLPNAVAFVLTTFGVWSVAATLWECTSADTAAIVYATGLLPVAAMQAVSTDTLLALWETAAAWAYVRAWRCGPDARPRVRRYYVGAMHAFFGLAMLTKGPIGLLPLLAIVPWNRRQASPVRLADPVGFAISLGVGLSWYVIVALRHPELWRTFLLDETLARAVTADAERNPEWFKPFVLYVPVLVSTVAPWLLLGRSRLAALKVNPRAAVGALRGREPHALLLLWVGVPLVLLFIVRSRLVLYALPLAAPAALLMGRFARPRNAAEQRILLRLAATVAGIMIATKGVMTFVPSSRDHAALAEFVRAHAAPDAVVVSVDRHHLPLHGLEFYLATEVPTVSTADESLEALLTDWAVSGETRPLFFVTRRSRAPYVLPVLDAHQIERTVAESHYWIGITVQPDALDPLAASAVPQPDAAA